MNKSKIYMIASICILCMSIIGSTFAYYRKELFNSNVDTITYGLDYYINYAKGQDIEAATLLPTNNYLDGQNSEIELWKKDNTYFIYGHIYLDINEIGVNLSRLSVLKYTLVSNDIKVAEGSIKGTSGESILIKSNIPLQTSKQTYKIYIWLENSPSLNTSVQAEKISLTVRCEATMKPINSIVSVITNLYNTAPKTEILNNTISYNYAASVNLMNDRLGGTTEDYNGGNIRYYGANPNNYVYFNCSDYNNQNEQTCELWRIIGIVDGKVKIIREDPLGNMLWDYDTSGIEADLTNNWTDSELNNILNNAYYNNLDNITYYKNPYNKDEYDDLNETVEEQTLNFASNNIGIKNHNTKNMIVSSIWYLGGYSTSQTVDSSQVYKQERTPSDRLTNWEGNIALAYPSDYGYAGDFNYCTGTLYSYNNTTCSSNNWLLHQKTYWLLTARSGSDSDPLDNVWSVENNGRVIYWDRVYYSREVYPTLYLNQYVIVSNGNGTKTNPYQLIQYQV